MVSWVKSPKFQNSTGFRRAKFLVSVTFEKLNNFFYNSSGIEMKLWPRKQNFFRNILRLKHNPFIFSVHVQMSHFETWLNLETNYQIFGIIKRYNLFFCLFIFPVCKLFKNMLQNHSFYMYAIFSKKLAPLTLRNTPTHIRG